jgi:hypothetical protein
VTVSRQLVSAAHEKFSALSRHGHRQLRRRAAVTIYRVTDRLHDRHVVYVPADGIAATVSAWLAELGADSPMAQDLVGALRAGDWPSAHGIADRLSVEVAVAA